MRRYDSIAGLSLEGMSRSRLWEILWGFILAGHESAADNERIHAVVGEWERINNTKWN